MDLGLKGKRALVLSSSRGLGLGVAQSLASEGADVMMTARSGDRLEGAAKAINAAGGGRAHTFVGDLAGSVDAIHQAAMQALGGIDILVANTGGPPARTALNVQAEEWLPQFQAMVLPVFKLAGLVLPGMRERGWGRILTIASTGVVQPIPNLVMSNALRSSIVGWSKTLAAEVAKDGVTVNLVLPGRIHTDRVDELTPRRNPRPWTKSPPRPGERSRPADTVGWRSSPIRFASWPPSGRATSPGASSGSMAARCGAYSRATA
jgi:3-oxoacyl-[acyl-carrier protein] reductase